MGIRGVFFMLISFLALAAAGCSSGLQNPGADSAPQEVKLRIWGSTPEHFGPQEVIEAWNEQHPDMPAEYVWYENSEAGNLKLGNRDYFGPRRGRVDRLQSGMAAETNSGRHGRTDG